MRGYFHRSLAPLILLLSFAPLLLILTTTNGAAQGLMLSTYGGILLATYAIAYAAARLLFVSVQKRQMERAKDEFLSFASHQLRTPLTTMNWRLEMLLAGDAGKLSKNQTTYVKEIDGETRRMTQLVSSFLNVSRINLGTLAVNPETCDISNLIESVIHEFDHDIAEKKLLIKKTFSRSLRSITSDPKILRMIIQNLLSNAIRYSNTQGRIMLTTAKEGDELVISVADTGVGIPENAQSKIFTKLFRADNVRRRNPDGNGIGLYIAKSLVDTAGGRIWFESEENKGSTFSVALPLIGMKQRSGNRTLSLTRS